MGPCKYCLVNSTCVKPCDKLTKYLNENKMIKRILAHIENNLTYRHGKYGYGHSHVCGNTGPSHAHSYGSYETTVDIKELIKRLGGNE